MSIILEQAEQLTQNLYHEKSHIHVENSVSTNSELMAKLTDGKLSPNCVHLLTADRQSGGRGQNGRSWQSPRGNVYLSLYYPTQHNLFPLTKPISGLLSLSVAYHLVDYLAQLPIMQKINQHFTKQHLTKQNLPTNLSTSSSINPPINSPRIGVKWANDIGFYDKVNEIDKTSNNDKIGDNNKWLFHKLSGILIEPVLSNGKMLGIIIGIGLNVETAPVLNNQTQEGMSYQSSSLADLLEADLLDREQSIDSSLKTEAKNNPLPLVHEFYKPISKAIFQAILTHQAVVNDDDKLAKFLADFAQVDILQGRQLSVTQNVQSQQNQAEKKLVQTGTAVGIDKFGCLLLKAEDNNVNRLFTGNIKVVK